MQEKDKETKTNTKDGEDQNKQHNIKKEALGRNIRRKQKLYLRWIYNGTLSQTLPEGIIPSGLLIIKGF